ncbi:MAG: aconitase X [Gammaproteobacteria bacterium]
MKRRDFVKGAALVPAAGAVAVATGVDSALADSAATNGDKVSDAQRAKGFRAVTDAAEAENFEIVACDQIGVDSDGNPITHSLTGTGSDAIAKHNPDNPFKMTLTQEEQDILNGSQGETMAKVLKTIVMHGELFGAERLADCGGAPHSSLYTAGPWITPVLEMFEEIADSGLQAYAPYTVNPMVVDLYTVGDDPVKRNMMLQGNPLQGRLIQVHTRLGARPIENWSCACYVPEVGNTADPGTAVSWAESSAVNYGNSVLGLRINRMATGMEVLCAIAGKVPEFGMLTDAGRQAKWHIDVQLSREPHWGALGGAIGAKVVEQVPYVTGIDQWIGMEDDKPNSVSMGKLKAMGSATASTGAVGLYHVEKVTPEAQKKARDLLTDDYQTYVIDDAEYARVLGTFENRWTDPEGDPTAVYIGCPHNTYDEIYYWTKRIDEALKAAGQKKVAVPVYLASSVVVRARLLDEHPVLARDSLRNGVQYMNICLPALQGLKGMAEVDRGVTNSNKARYYTRCRLYGDDELLEIAVTGKVPAQNFS